MTTYCSFSLVGIKTIKNKRRRPDYVELIQSTREDRLANNDVADDIVLQDEAVALIPRPQVELMEVPALGSPTDRDRDPRLHLNPEKLGWQRKQVILPQMLMAQFLRKGELKKCGHLVMMKIQKMNIFYYLHLGDRRKY